MGMWMVTSQFGTLYSGVVFFAVLLVGMFGLSAVVQVRPTMLWDLLKMELAVGLVLVAAFPVARCLSFVSYYEFVPISPASFVLLFVVGTAGVIASLVL